MKKRCHWYILSEIAYAREKALMASVSATCRYTADCDCHTMAVNLRTGIVFSFIECGAAL